MSSHGPRPASPRHARPSLARRGAPLILPTLVAGQLIAQPVTPPPAPISPALRVPTPTLSDADRVSDYLQALGLRGLLIEQLSARLRTADASDRPRLAERLGRLYAAAIADASTPEARQGLITEAEKLLRAVPQTRAFELRVNLLRERYLLAEDAAERARLRIGPDRGVAARKDATELVNVIKPELEKLLSELTRREQQVQATLENNPNIDVPTFEVELADLRRWRSTVNYYVGWTSYYRALLAHSAAAPGAAPQPATQPPTRADASAPWRADAQDALRAFAQTLNISPGQGMPADMDTTPFRFEHIARSAAGTALALGLLGRDVEALAWLGALRDQPQTHPSLAGQWLAWRVMILAQAGRWADIQRDLADIRTPLRPGSERSPMMQLPEVPGQSGVVALPVATSRVVVALALESLSADDPAADVKRAVAQVAVNDLIIRREVSAVLEIARQHGTIVLGTSGFVPIYVLAHQRLDEAQTLHAASSKAIDEPATSAEAINAFLEAARLFTQSTTEADARFFARESAQAWQFTARAQFFAGRLRESAESFARSSEQLRTLGDRSAAEETLWLAIGTLGKAATRELSPLDKAAVEQRETQLAELYVREHPGTDRAAQLALRQLAREDRVDEAAVRVLMSVNRTSPLYEQTRRQLARVLYRLYRAAPASERAFAGARFIRVADELLAIDQSRALATASAPAPQAAASRQQATELAVITARQMLDVLLTGPTPDATRADGVLQAVERIIAAAGPSLTNQAGAIADELALRRVQLAIAQGDLATAESRADAFSTRIRDLRTAPQEVRTQATRYYLAARSSLLNDATRHLATEVQPASAQRLDAARRVMKHGMLLLDQLTLTSPGGSANPFNDPNVVATASAVADAGMILATESTDQTTKADARETALRLDRQILQARPNVRNSLLRVATLTEQAGNREASLEAWRTLASGLEESTEPWAQARYHTLRLTAELNPAQGIVAMRQHLTLHPRVAEPWQAQIITLARSLGVDPARPNPVQQPPTPPSTGGPNP
jgi:hypothetical protein